MEEVKNNQSNLEKNKSIRVGRYTLGFTLIIFGISVILQMFVKFEVLRYVFMLWPLIFISLGVEILYFNKKVENIKYDVAGIVLMIFLIFFGMVIGALNFGINQVLYNDNIKSQIIDNSIDDDLSFNVSLNKNIKIINITNKKVNVKVIEVENIEYTYVKIKGSKKEDNNLNVVDAISGKYNMYDMIDTNNIDSNNTHILVQDDGDCFDSIDIIITTDNKDKISYSGEIIKL